MQSSEQAGWSSRGKGTFPSGFLDDVRHAVGIASVVEQHVALKRAGRTLKGLCPFHSEKTPSFHVDEAKGFYHCFGCGAGGDVFKFVMQLEALTFPEAVRAVAEKAGLRVPELRAPSAADDLRERILSINAAAQEVFLAELGGQRADARAAREYLAKRGIGEDIVTGMGLGFAPESWSFLGPKLSGRFEERELTASGLLAPSTDGRSPYDRFRGRVTFPIRAVSDRIVGFGGRILGDGEPKYLNSPETPVYTKGRHLYGLDRARAGIRRTGHAVIVEGYLDCISLHAHGVDQAVAVLGTALTPEQARLLGRFTKKAVLSFDGDTAGQRAAQRSVPVLLAEGFDVRVLELAGGADPDDHVRRVGGPAFQREVEQAEPFMSFLVGMARREHDVTSPTGRVKALHDILPLVVGISDPVLRAELADGAALGLGIRAELVREEVRRMLRQGRSGAPAQAASPVVEEKEPEHSHAEGQLVTWMLADARARRAARERLGAELVRAMPLGVIIGALMKVEERDDAPLDMADLMDGLPEGWPRRVVARLAVAGHHESVDPRLLGERMEALAEALGAGPMDDLRRRKAELDRLWTAAKANGDEAWKRIYQEATEIGRAIHR